MVYITLNKKKKKKRERKPIIFFIKTKIFRSYLLQCNVATTSVIVCTLREENKELLKIFANFLGQVVLQFLMNYCDFFFFFKFGRYGKINLKENANENEIIFSLLFLKINEESGKKSCFAACLCNIWFLIMYVCL